MPYLCIQSNCEFSDQKRQAVLVRASTLVASMLGKPESYVMTDFRPTSSMSFAGTFEPCAYVELKSIGLPENKTAALSEALCALIQLELEVPGNRTYIEFSDARNTMWGWNNSTF